MLIDCDRCEVRGIACGDCVIGVLLSTPEEDRPVPYLPVDAPEPAGLDTPLELAEPERRALEILADQGLIPRLRLVQHTDGPAGVGSAAARDAAGSPAARGADGRSAAARRAAG